MTIPGPMPLPHLLSTHFFPTFYGLGALKINNSNKYILTPYSSDLGEAVGSKVDRRSSPHNFYNLSKHQVVARMEAHQGRIESQPHARSRTIKK